MASVRDALDGHSQTLPRRRRPSRKSHGGDLDRSRAQGAEARGGGGRARGGEQAEEAARREAEAARVAARGDGGGAAAALAEAREGHVGLLARMADMEAALAGRAVPRTPTAERPPLRRAAADGSGGAALNTQVGGWRRRCRRVARSRKRGDDLAHGGATESAGTTGGAVVSNAPVSPLSFEEARRAALRRAEGRRRRGRCSGRCVRSVSRAFGLDI